MAIAALAARPATGQVVISPDQQSRGGIALETLQAMRMSRSIPAVGVVLDPTALIALAGQIATVDAEITGAKANVVLEQQEMAQASSLYKHGQVISLADYQKAAQELAASDAALAVAHAKRQSLLQQIGAAWGPAVAGILRGGGDPLPQLADHTATLVGLSLPPGVSLAAPPPELEAEAAGIRFSARLIATVPKMLGGFPGQGILYQATPQPGVPIGTTVSATLSVGPERKGVLVPWSAVLWQHGRATVFRAAVKGGFEPVPISTDSPTAQGYFVSERLARGNRVVVRGAALLLGGPNPAAGGESEDEDED